MGLAGTPTKSNRKGLRPVYSTFVGLDVHSDQITVARANTGGSDPEVLGRIANTPQAVGRLVRKRLGDLETLHVCYEAGPCGYGICRQLRDMGVKCSVVAPSLIPKAPGDRVKTDRRDACKLARLLRSGDLTAVYVPTKADEALRDLARARHAAKKDEKRVSNRLKKFLLKEGVYPPEGVNPGTIRYREWLQALRFESLAHSATLAEHLRTIDEAQARVARLDGVIEELVPESEQYHLIMALQAMRGVKLLTATTVVLEVGDFLRFEHPRYLMGYTGLVPTEQSSNNRRRQGGITRTGNAHLRRILVEAAWCYRYPPRVSRTMKRRQTGVSPEVESLAWKAQNRLHTRYRRLMKRGVPQNKVVVAVARELTAFMWDIARQVAVEVAEPTKQGVA